MNTSTEQLIIKELGILALIGLTGTLIILAVNISVEVAIITALITFVSSITGGLIGYLGGKNTTIQANDDDEQTDNETEATPEGDTINEVNNEYETPQQQYREKT